jgi:hypothetical protein
VFEELLKTTVLYFMMSEHRRNTRRTDNRVEIRHFKILVLNQVVLARFQLFSEAMKYFGMCKLA